jgi:hypothetical protein
MQLKYRMVTVLLYDEVQSMATQAVWYVLTLPCASASSIVALPLPMVDDSETLFM